MSAPRPPILVFLVCTLLLTLAARAHAGQEDTFQSLSARADTARSSGRLPEAIDRYRSALELKPDWAEGWWYLGTSLYELDRYREAAEALERLALLAPEDGSTRALLGLSRFQTGDYGASLSELLRARSLGMPGNRQLLSVVRYHIGILLCRRGRFEDAFEALEWFAYEDTRALNILEAFGLSVLRIPRLPKELAPAEREMVLLAGRAAFEFAAEKFEVAEQLYRALSERYPDQPNVHYAFGAALATIRGRQGLSREDAVRQFQKELVISPGHIPSLLQLAFEAISRGAFEEARPYTEKALEIEPDSFAAHNALGRILLEEGKLEESIRALEASVRLAPDIPETRFTLARAYQKAGRTAEASRQRAEFERLSRLKDEAVRELH